MSFNIFGQFAESEGSQLANYTAFEAKSNFNSHVTNLYSQEGKVRKTYLRKLLVYMVSLFVAFTLCIG